MRAVRRMALALAAFLCVFALCACGEANKRAYLERDEYDVYAGTEFVTNYLSANLGRMGERCDFAHIASLFDFPVEELNTKRGIRIGSSLADMVDVYSGMTD